jgi:hypothetical protein
LLEVVLKTREKQMMLMKVALVILICVQLCMAMPLPFKRVLRVQVPPMEGTDVLYCQQLVSRANAAPLKISKVYDNATADAVRQFQQSQATLKSNGAVEFSVLGELSAQQLLSVASCDGVRDVGKPASAYGEQYKYKFYVPVYRNRSVESKAMLFDAHNRLLMDFVVRAHGHSADDDDGWPNWNNDVGLNQFSSDGNTPTGVVQVDLNSPEGNPTLYGPYPVNRFFGGLEGNAAFILSASESTRTGILLHTGQWPGWPGPAHSMPNSAGCMHAHPHIIERIWLTLVSLGVEVRKNPGGVQPYPFAPQGIAVIEQVRCQ